MHRGKFLNMKKIAIKQEKEVLKAAMRSFAAATGTSAQMLSTEFFQTDDSQPDAMMEFSFRGDKHRLYVGLRGELRQTMLLGLLSQFDKNREKWILVAKYIPGPLKEELKRNGINYLEVSGNCFISTGRIFLYVNDREVKPARQKPSGRLWTVSGLKLLFVLIQDPELVEASYRKLSELSGIALGSISPLIHELSQEGYIKEDDSTGKKKLVNIGRLLDRWVEIYPVMLRPRLSMGAFRFIATQSNDVWRKKQTEGVYWGGEPGGDIYTDHLKPEAFTVYTTREPNELVKLLKIVPDEKGNVVLIEKFWKDWPGNRSIQGAVPPLLVYADLIDGNDSRNWEIAERVKAEFIDGKHTT